MSTFDCKDRRKHRSLMFLGMGPVCDICALLDVCILEVLLLMSMLKNQCAISFAPVF